jgi:Tfp pilus assembly protein PilF
VDYQLALVLRRLDRTAEADAAHRRFTERRRLRWELEAASREAEAAPRDAGRQQYEAGRLSRAVGDDDAAARWFRQALRIDPNHRPSHAALAEYYARQPDPAAQARAAEHGRRAGLMP